MYGGRNIASCWRSAFRPCEFHIGHHVEDAENIIAGIDVIIGLGHHIPPALIAKAKNLKWVQALTTGTETLTAPGVLPPHVLLTSTRGIHGPQMSELAFLNMIALARELQKECCATRPRANGSNGTSRSSKARPSSSSAWACWPSISPSAASCSA